MGEILKIKDYVAHSPILKRGELVRLVYPEKYMERSKHHFEFEDPGEEIDWENGVLHLGNCCGVVVGVVFCAGQDDEAAPGQALVVNLAFPFEEGWETLEMVPIECVHRVLSKDLHEMAEEEAVN